MIYINYFRSGNSTSRLPRRKSAHEREEVRFIHYLLSESEKIPLIGYHVDSNFDCNLDAVEMFTSTQDSQAHGLPQRLGSEGNVQGGWTGRSQ